MNSFKFSTYISIPICFLTTMTYSTVMTLYVLFYSPDRVFKWTMIPNLALSFSANIILLGIFVHRVRKNIVNLIELRNYACYRYTNSLSMFVINLSYFYLIGLQYFYLYYFCPYSVFEPEEYAYIIYTYMFLISGLFSLLIIILILYSISSIYGKITGTD